jgi:CDP-diacylglycerol--serine O-phosphatidyltransferase
MLPIYLWIVTGLPVLRQPLFVGAWLAVIAFLMISSVATLGWGLLRPRRSIRIEVLAMLCLAGAAMLTEPWLSMIGICVLYIALLPYGIWSYARVKQRRVGLASDAQGQNAA